MVRVHLIGGSGFIGTAAIRALRTQGHRVYSVARNAEKAKHLAKIEAIPVLATEEDPYGFQTVEKENIDVIIDLAGSPEACYAILEGAKALGQKRIDRYFSTNHAFVPKLGLVVISGTWVHGSSHNYINDLDPVKTDFAPTQPPRITSWRPDLERSVMAARDVLDVVILRPSLVYGQHSPIWVAPFAPLYKAHVSNAPSVDIHVKKHSRLGLVHVEDLANGISLAASKISALGGAYPVFDIGTSCESFEEIVLASAAGLGYKGTVNFVDPPADNAFVEAFGTSANLSYERASSLLGWVPKRLSMLADADLYVNAWVAGNT
jgi:nucleoside-diphosphate-sugar epimerase